MTSLADLLAYKAARTPVWFNSQQWHIEAAGWCVVGDCDQRSRGRTCAGVVALANADGERWWGLHVDAAADLTTEPTIPV